ncbi:MAG: hypothetical protein M1840_004009 [Geoglossum simile]|nr:MAG: hypothetical protein M1840_004009 [Geoglossum simile]
MSKTFTASDVATHNNADNGMYIIVEGSVYDITGKAYPSWEELLGFIEEHPGGSKILKRVAGKDATKQFWKYHSEHVLKKYAEKLKIGVVEEKATARL